MKPHNCIFDFPSYGCGRFEQTGLLGLAGAALLPAMWTVHYFLFRTPGWIALVGTVVVVENVVSSLAHSHLFDFMHGWLYVLWRHGVAAISAAPDAATDEDYRRLQSRIAQTRVTSRNLDRAHKARYRRSLPLRKS